MHAIEGLVWPAYDGRELYLRKEMTYYNQRRRSEAYQYRIFALTKMQDWSGQISEELA